MINRITYECEHCHKKSANFEEIRNCEAEHYGLAINDYNIYKLLQDIVKYRSFVVSYTNNPETRAQEDLAIKRLLDFEKEHIIQSC